jgi:hypothetical protein
MHHCTGCVQKHNFDASQLLHCWLKENCTVTVFAGPDRMHNATMITPHAAIAQAAFKKHDVDCRGAIGPRELSQLLKDLHLKTR